MAMDSTSKAINHIITQNIPLKLPSNESKTVSLDILVSVDGEEATHTWEFVWCSIYFAAPPSNSRYCFELSLSLKQKDNYKYGKSFCKIKIKDDRGALAVEETKDLVAPDYNQFEFAKLMSFGGRYLRQIMVSVILQSYPTDSPSENVLERMLDSGNQAEIILKSNPTDSPPQSAFKNMLDSETLTDVVILTKSGNFPCHKVVLASQSEYFETMFLTDMKVKKESIVNWVGVFEADVVSDLLDYLYTGQAPPNFPNTCKELMKVGHMCLMDRLKTLCGERLKETLTVENVGEMLGVATKYEAEKLQEAAVDFIVANFTSNDLTPALWDTVEPEFGKNLAITIIKALVAKTICI